MQNMDEIYRNHARMVYRYLMSKTGNETIAEEVTQETFYQAIKNSDRYDGSCKVTTWLCSIADNQLKNYLRKNRIHDQVEETSATVPSSEELLLKEENRIELLKLLHKVEEPYREVLYLRMYGNLSFREIGEVLNRSENWARVTFYRAKEIIRKELVKHE